MEKWFFNGEEVNSLDDIPKIKNNKPFGFVYELKLYDKRGRLRYIYIGKKNFISERHIVATKKDMKELPLKSFKRRKTKSGVKYYKKQVKESDWLTYCSSNDFIKKNKSKFVIHKTIIRLCESDSELSYREAQEIICRDAMDDPLYLNNGVSIRRFATKVF